MVNNQSILEKWKISEQELTIIIMENPSLRGIALGYVAEYKLRSLLLANSQVTSLRKPDDHKRGHGNKNDMIITYRDYEFSVEVKSLQTNSIKKNKETGVLSATAQVDASDRRPVTLSDGSKLETTCLLRGEFDLLAVNVFQFQEQWDFGFILNRDLQHSTSNKYTSFQQEQLLATSTRVTWPLQIPYALNPFDLLDILIAERESTSS